MKKGFWITVTAVFVTVITAVALCLQALNAPRTVASFADGGMRIVVDAGHGGIDGGVVGKKTGIKESDINLAVSYFLKDVLTEMGFEVTLTRKTDAGLYGSTAKGFKKRDMQKRKEIIENCEPALVISVHQNYYSSRAYRGGQVFYRKGDGQGQVFAEAVQGKLNALYETDGAKPRSVMAGDYFMLKCAPCPSVIVECGFLSNVQDESLLGTELWRKKLAQAVAAGVVAYLSDSAA